MHPGPLLVDRQRGEVTDPNSSHTFLQEHTPHYFRMKRQLDFTRSASSRLYWTWKRE